MQPLEKIIEINLRQMREATNGQAPRQTWLIVGLATSEDVARTIRRTLDTLVAPRRAVCHE